MSAARFRRTNAFVALPVILSVVLVTLCVPVACATGAPMMGNCDTANVPMRDSHGSMPLHHTDSGSGSGSGTCKHKDVPAQAVTSQQQVLFDQVVAPALAVDPTPILPAAPVVHHVLQGASPPTSVLLTASQLRI